MGIKHNTIGSFKYAFEGIVAAFKKEPNFKIHIFTTFAVSVFAYVLKFNPIEWLILLLTICLVLVLELINTAIESIVNLVSPEIKDEAKIAKDVSAAAVFLSAFLAVTVGIILFLPKIVK